MPWKEELQLSGYDAAPRHTHPSRIGGPAIPKGDEIQVARTELKRLLAVTNWKPSRANTAVKNLRDSLLERWKHQDASLSGEVDVQHLHCTCQCSLGCHCTMRRPMRAELAIAKPDPAHSQSVLQLASAYVSAGINQAAV